MSGSYRGLPAAATVEQSILAAQVMIRRDLEWARSHPTDRGYRGTFAGLPAFQR